VIHENDDFLVFAPFASRVPFESWIVPKAHRPRFERTTDREGLALADCLHDLTRRVKLGLNDPPYNLFVHTTPTRHVGEGYHWHAELLPKLTIAAGFELGTDVYINVVTPESAADFLRSTGTGGASGGQEAPRTHA
jgi:UDPglucose--hexose-1-phosphate uridylyltransferase